MWLDAVADRVLLVGLLKMKTTFKTALTEQTEELQTSQDASLGAMAIGRSARILSVNASLAVARRVMELGLVPGVLIRVVRTAPLGDPIQVCVRGYHLALRRSDAHAIKVRFTTETPSGSLSQTL